jgi:WD40 repeat protein
MLQERVVDRDSAEARFAFSRDGSKLAIADHLEGNERGLRVVDVASGKRIREYPKVGWRNNQWTAWLPDNRTLVVVPNDGRVHVVDTETGNELRTFELRGKPVVPNRDGSRLVVQIGGGAARVYDTATFDLLYTMLYLRDGRWAVLSPDGHFRGSPGIEKLLCYVVQTEQGQETLTPDQFAARFGWKNDPTKVNYRGDAISSAAPATTPGK